jgi:hypothetical protein
MFLKDGEENDVRRIIAAHPKLQTSEFTLPDTLTVR